MSLIAATLIKRYKRFLADVRLNDGTQCTVHCPNPGAMTGLAEVGMQVYLRAVTNPKAKLPYRWIITETPTARVGVDTMRANDVMDDALQVGHIPDLARWTEIQREVKVDAQTRLDFCLSVGVQKNYLEVKSATLSLRDGIASFPDTPTKRGQKHLQTLMNLRQQGHAATLIFVVQRDDCVAFQLASAIDPDYVRLCQQAIAAGVAVQAWGCTIQPSADVITLHQPLRWQEAP